MKIAAIDLGTNTFHLIIAEKSDSEMNIIYKTNKPIKLGEDITKENKIIPAAFERAINCLKDFKATLNQYGVTKIRAVATSGVRSASNGQDFIHTVKKETGIAIDMINGEEEASLIYEAVKYSGAIQGKSLIMDIGGGSTEFIFCDENGFYWKKSFDIGAARLMQKFFKSDPINQENQNQINQHLKENLSELIEFGETFRATTLIGSAGAFETYAEVLNPSIVLNEIANAPIDIEAYHQLSKKFLHSTHQERSEMPNLIPLRVDMIVMASMITDYVLAELGLKAITLSTYDLKMGVLKDLQNN
ncbi:exopolyphosphatase [Pedobacter xixiisoli]|uniref:Exopolyphosphatase / guanosine-5'-triphosphate,3'-diphosphate pyrophosphatase n=1 Tax=Pedobacter xixiisoli TaxID=1476464 RepID=A0A286AAS7_9SPHI|nr:exopolyphosphatase [Pedobacter xixiisoli]SOD18982.1 exopolyphosphatase / guanosine-5'-triphosphate,3'-diphosphate pyrophosphatase [Pedobacter xixiisoli]